jgi:cell division transport system permease protein
MNRWLNHNRQAMELILSRMRGNMLSTLMMFCVMGVTICLPGMLYVIVDNLNRLAGDIQSQPRISLFLKLDINADEIAELERQLSAHPNIKSQNFVSRDSAWEQMQMDAGSEGMASNLAKNPLPDAYFVEPKLLEPEAIESMQKEMQEWPGVELAQVDASWIKRLYSLLELGKKAILVLALLLGFALIAIIGNTIRLQILTHREEIEVSKLIGATDSFIRRPFLYAGALYGLGGGFSAWLLLAGVVLLFNYSVTEIAAQYASNFRLGLPVWQVNVAMIASAMGLGWIGSYVAVNRALSQFDLK